jgi:hypothetical protein
LVNRPVSVNDRIPFIQAIFSDLDEVEAVKSLRGGEAQAFVDVLDEVLCRLSPQKNYRADPNFSIM